jgi:hypothetical protein
MPVDKFYGFQETAELCEHVITSLFTVSPAPAATDASTQLGLDTPPQSPTQTSSKDGPPPLGEFIAYALYRTRLPIAITHQALLLLSRLKARYPSARGTATSPHRLFLSSLMLSSKISMDDTYSNKSWQVVGQGLFVLKEVNQMERELFAFLGWNVVVRDEELAQWVGDVVRPYEAARAAAAPTSLLATRKPAEDRKRRRDDPKTSSSSSSVPRSPSPDELRHRRASDAAVALLHGDQSAPSSYEASRTARRSRPSTPDSYSSSSSSTRGSSSASSSLSSPVSALSGFTTPGSPSTPVSAGPVTPEFSDDRAPPAWAAFGCTAKACPPTGPIQVATW